MCVCVCLILYHFCCCCLMPLLPRHKPHTNISPGKFGCSQVIDVHKVPAGKVRQACVCAQRPLVLCTRQVGKTGVSHSLQTSKPAESNTAPPGGTHTLGFLLLLLVCLHPSPLPRLSLIRAHLSKMEEKKKAGNGA